jgi:hypothetical protein
MDIHGVGPDMLEKKVSIHLVTETRKTASTRAVLEPRLRVD